MRGLDGQVPLIQATERFKGTQMGNVIFWLSIMLGQARALSSPPLCCHASTLPLALPRLRTSPHLYVSTISLRMPGCAGDVGRRRAEGCVVQPLIVLLYGRDHVKGLCGPWNEADTAFWTALLSAAKTNTTAQP